MPCLLSLMPLLQRINSEFMSIHSINLALFPFVTLCMIDTIVRCV